MVRVAVGALFVAAVIITLVTLFSFVVSTITMIVEIAIVVGLGVVAWRVMHRR
jgi:hypothetical protein